MEQLLSDVSCSFCSHVAVTSLKFSSWLVHLAGQCFRQHSGEFDQEMKVDLVVLVIDVTAIESYCKDI